MQSGFSQNVSIHLLVNQSILCTNYTIHLIWDCQIPYQELNKILLMIDRDLNLYCDDILLIAYIFYLEIFLFSYTDSQKSKSI